jgi:hypothetical protein
MASPAAPWDSRAAAPDEDNPMLARMIMAVPVAVLVALPAAAKDCPTSDLGYEAREQAVRQAPNCKTALDVMEACAFGATGDRALADIIQKKCEPLFLTRLSKAQRRSYDREQRHCDQKYAHQSGTMYRSASAFCQAQSTVSYVARYGAKPK